MLLGFCHWWQARFDLSVEAESALRQAEAMVARVRAIDPGNGITFMLEGGIAHLRDQHPDAVRMCRAAVDCAPSDAHSVAFCGYICSFAGLQDEAIARLRQAMRLSPQYPPWYDYHLALASLWAGNTGSARHLMQGYHDQVPDDPYGYAMCAFAMGFDGDTARATALVAQLMQVFPDFGITHLLRSEHYADAARKDRVMAILRKAGLRE